MIDFIMAMTSPDPTLITILGGMIASLGTAIGVLWKTIMSHISRLESSLKECELDRKQLHDEQTNLWMVIAKQSGKDVNELKGNKE